MTKEEKEKRLRDAVLSLDPNEIRKAGEETGHPIRVEQDMEIIYLAAQVILMFIPDAPKEAVSKARSILGLDNIFFRGFKFF